MARTSQLGRAELGKAQLGASEVTLDGVRPPGLLSTAAFGSQGIASDGVTVPGLVALADFGFYKVLAPGVAPPSLLGSALLGPPRVTEASLQAPSLVGPGLFGSQEIGGLFVTGLVGTALFGAHSTASLITLIDGLVARAQFGRPSILPEDQDFALIIGGTKRNDVWFSVSGIEISYAANGGSSARFVIFDPSGAYVPAPGQEVRFYMGTELWFVGIIKTTNQTRVPDAAETAEATACIVNDLAAELLQRRVVFGFFEDEDQNFAVETIETRFLREEGINSIPGAAFAGASDADRNYQPMLAFEFLNQIGGEIGADWFMDEYRQIFWFKRGTPWTPSAGTYKQTYDDGDLLEGQGSLEVTKSSGEYANKVFVQMGSANPSFSEEAFSTLPLDLFPANAVFLTTYPINVEPTITVYDDDPDAGGVTSLLLTDVIVGLLVPSSGWQALYVPGEDFITLNRVEVDAALGAAVKAVVVDYAVADGASPFVSAEDDDAIELQRVAEGGLTTGKYERVEHQTDVEDLDVAQVLAENLIARYSDASGDFPSQISFESNITGITGRILPGMTITVSFSRPAVSGVFLVESVTLREIEHSLQAVEAPYLRAKITATDAGNVQFRPVQNVRHQRPKMNRTIVFALAQDLQGGSNAGLAVDDERSQTVMQTGKLADINMYFEVPVTGDAETDQLSVDISHAPAATPTTFTKLVDVQAAVGASFSPSKVIDFKVRVNDVLKIKVTQVGTGGARNGVLLIRQFI